MSAPRFYCPPPLPQNNHCELPPEAAHHASRVLRLRVGDAVGIQIDLEAAHVFDANGRITRTGKTPFHPHKATT